MNSTWTDKIGAVLIHSATGVFMGFHAFGAALRVGLGCAAPE